MDNQEAQEAARAAVEAGLEDPKTKLQLLSSGHAALANRPNSTIREQVQTQAMEASKDGNGGQSESGKDGKW